MKEVGITDQTNWNSLGPQLARRYPFGFAFYLTDPVSSIARMLLREALWSAATGRRFLFQPRITRIARMFGKWRMTKKH